MRKRRLAQARRPEEQQVVQRLASLAGRRNEDLKLLAHRGLTHVVGQTLRTQGAVYIVFIGAVARGGNDAFDGLHE